MLTVKNLKFYYTPQRTILEDISFSIKKGEVACILGPNGAGKTTLLRCILGLNKIKNGEIIIHDQNITQSKANIRAKMLAYVPQHSTIDFPYTVKEVVLMGRTAHLQGVNNFSKEDIQIANSFLEKLEIQHLGNKLFKNLSGGEQQMVLITRALTQKAEYLVMDEPTASLDYSNQIKILSLIKKLAQDGYSIIMTSHFPDHAFLTCHKAILIHNGHIFLEGDPHVVLNSDTLSELYNTKVLVTTTQPDDTFDVFKVCVPILD